MSAFQIKTLLTYKNNMLPFSIPFSKNVIFEMYNAKLKYFPSMAFSSNILVALRLAFSVPSLLPVKNPSTYKFLPMRGIMAQIEPYSIYCKDFTARTSITLLNNSGESGHPCLVPDLSGNAFSFSPLKIMFAVGLLYGFSMLR